MFANYCAVFRDVNGMFNSVANFIYNSTGRWRRIPNWMNQLAQYWQANGNTSLWNLVTGRLSGVISLDSDSERVHPLSHLLSLIHRFLRDLWVGALCHRPFCLGAAADPGPRAVVTHLLGEPDDVSGLGTHLRSSSSPHVSGESSSINAVLSANGVLNSFAGSSQMMLLALTTSIFLILDLH